MPRPSLLFSALLGLTSACGGRVDDGAPRQPDTANDPAEDSPAGETAPPGMTDQPNLPPGTGGSPANSGNPLEPDAHQLGDCQLGTPPAPGKVCPWLADDLCYASKDAACNCICPAVGSSLCVSGLPGDATSRTPVSCF